MWEPDTNHHAVSTFIEAIDNGIEYLHTKKTTLPKSNLRIQGKKALKELANRDDLIFRKVG